MARSVWGQAAEFESNVARDEDVSDVDIHFSRLSGMAPSDIDRLRDFSLSESLLIVIRCPKRPARYYHGKHQPKTFATSIYRDPDTGKGLKSDPATGLVTLPDGRKQVSDYDLMCVYRFWGDDGYEKINFSGMDPSNKRSRLSEEATRILRKVNRSLKSAFQHGAQDDYEAKDNPNLNVGGKSGERPDRFAVFNLGHVSYFPNPASVKKDVYDKHGLDWPYDETTGKHRASSG